MKCWFDLRVTLKIEKIAQAILYFGYNYPIGIINNFVDRYQFCTKRSMRDVSLPQPNTQVADKGGRYHNVHIESDAAQLHSAMEKSILCFRLVLPGIVYHLHNI